MIQVPSDLRAALYSTTNKPVDLYELYLDSGTLYYADQDITWGGHHYLPKVRSRSSIKRYMGGQFDAVSVTFSNVDETVAAALLASEIEGRRLVIRKIDRSVATSSIVLFDGRMDPLSKVNLETVEISAKHILGSIDADAPARTFGELCGWDFKSPQCGYAGSETQCNKSWARCNELGQSARYGGFRFIPHSGTFQYKETSTQRFLLLFRRKKTKTITASFSSIDDTPYGVPIPIVYGRSQLSGIVIEHEDAGGVTKALVAFCIGKVQDFFYVRANQMAVSDVQYHYGNFGGDPGQGVDTRFPDSYPYSQLAFLGITIPGDVHAVDPAPDVTAVILGRGVPTFDEDGVYTGFSGYTDNPVWNTRDFMTLPLVEGGMGIPEELIDDTVSFETAGYCDELIEDATGDQQVFNPLNLPDGVDYQRYQSTGVDGVDPDTEAARSDYEPGVNDDTSTTPATVMVKRFTMNGAIAKQEKAVDILFNKLLPSFRGYLTQSAEGKIQIRCEKPVQNGVLTGAAAIGATSLTCDPDGWAEDDLVLVAPYTASAEVVTVAAVAGGGLSLSGGTRFAHSADDVILRVAMAFDDSNLVRDFEYPLRDRQNSTNRIAIKYVDAPAGFQEKELHVNDYEHQSQVHKVNSEDVDGGMIDSYFQAWRIGEWLRAKRRDLGSFCAGVADITATLLEVGDVVAVSAGEAGLQCVPFLLQEVEYLESDEVGLVGQLYSLDVYSDTAPQCTVQVPTIFSGLTAGGPPRPAAPNVLAATPAFTASQIGGRPVLVPSATVTMPVDDPDYARLKKLKVIIHAPDTIFTGVTEELEVTAPFDVDGDDNLVVTLPAILQDTKAHTYDWTFRVENDDGSITPGALTVANVAAAAAAGPDVPPANVASITGGEAAGTRYAEDGTRLLRAKFDATVTLTADQGFQTFFLLLSKDNGAHWQGIGWYPASGTTGTARIDQAIPVTNETWKFAAKQGRVPYDASVLIADADLPAGTVRQTVGFTVNGLALAAANAITDCVVPAGTGPVGAPYNTVSQDGYFQWAHIPYVSYTDPTDPNGFFVRFTDQDLDASHTPIGPEKPGVGYLVSGGAKKTDPLDADYISPGDGGAATKYVRRRCYVCNRVNQGLYSFQDTACAALQTTAWSGAAYKDVFIGTPPAGSVPGSSVSGPVAQATTATTANSANTATLANQVPGSGIIGTITLGGGGTVTTVAETKDAGGARVAWFGKVGSDYGIWAKNAWFGGTGPSDPRIWLDVGGAGHFKGAIESGSTITAPAITGGTITGAVIQSILGSESVTIQNGQVQLSSGGSTTTTLGSASVNVSGSFGNVSHNAQAITIFGGGSAVASLSRTGGLVISSGGASVGGVDATGGVFGVSYRLWTGMTVISSGGQFVGTGVYCPSYSVTCSGLVVAGFTGATMDITFKDSLGGFCTLNGSAVRQSFKGGAFVGLI